MNLDPGPAPLRRLTNAEYRATVRELLGVDLSAVVATFPGDDAAGGFSNDAGGQTLSALLADRYQAAAADAAAKVSATPASRQAVVGCEPAGAMRAGCLRAFVEKVGRRAFRRPLVAAETDRLLALTTDEDAAGSVELVVQALLQSPKFLFRPELGVGEPARPGLLRLTGAEVATRLSFFLLGTAPDAALLDAAAAGRLDSAAGVEAAARTLLSGARTRTALRAFTGEWLHLEALSQAMRDTRRFPLFSPALLRSMADEVHRLVEDAFWRPGASALELYTSRAGWVDAPLARLYGVAAPASGTARVDFGASPDRGGLFTTAGFLTGSGRGNETSPILRGKQVREMALCQRLPPPLPGVAMLEVKPGESAADAESRHTADPACAGCHVLIDPIGHGLERYDAIGAMRTAHANGRPIEQRGRIEGLAASSFAGGVELGRVVASSDRGASCVVSKTMRWALGRDEDAADGCAVAALVGELRRTGHGFPALVAALVKSDTFRYRRKPAN